MIKRVALDVHASQTLARLIHDDVGGGWSFESSVRLESGMHFVTGSPEPGHSSIAAADATLVYRFPD